MEHCGPSFKAVLRSHLLDGMLRGGQGAGGAGEAWRVLVVDAVTVKVISSCCSMSELLDVGVSLVEDLNKRREPQPRLAAVYFLQPTAESVARLLQDFASEAAPQYRAAHVFFSSQLPGELLAAVKGCHPLVARLEALKEVNAEVVAVDARAFTTGPAGALGLLYADHASLSARYEGAIESVARRLATVFATLKEHPAIRYAAVKSGAAAGGRQTAAEAARAQLPQRLASAVYAELQALPPQVGLPAQESCELLIVDRTVDVVAPVIHEWTYGAMCHDLLPLRGDHFAYTTQTVGGKAEERTAELGEADALWCELRHLHIADVMLRLADKTRAFAAKNQAARQGGGAGPGGALTTGQMKRLVEALPQYRSQIQKLDLHSEIGKRLNLAVAQRHLNAVGEVEQAVVFGEAKSKAIVKLLGEHADLLPQDKLRVLLCYMATHPEKLDAAERLKWVKLASLSASDIHAVNNLEHLGVQLEKRSTAAKAREALTWGRGGGGGKGGGAAALRHRENDAEWQLARFQPLVQSLMDDLAAATLSEEDFPWVHAPAGGGSGGRRGAAAAPPKARGVSARSVRSTLSSWSKPSASAAATAFGASSAAAGLGGGAADDGGHRRRLVVFVLGGMTHSEVRAAHDVARATGRDVLLGSTSLDTPAVFLQHLKDLSSLEEVSL